jgi:hypothetical protein
VDTKVVLDMMVKEKLPTHLPGVKPQPFKLTVHHFSELKQSIQNYKYQQGSHFKLSRIALNKKIGKYFKP